MRKAGGKAWKSHATHGPAVVEGHGGADVALRAALSGMAPLRCMCAAFVDMDVLVKYIHKFIGQQA